MAAMTSRSARIRILAILIGIVCLLFVAILPFRSSSSFRLPDSVSNLIDSEKKKPAPAPPKGPVYKPTPTPAPPIVDNFPLAASAKSPSDLPPIPSWNTPPSPHVTESTPLFIGFTRNWLLLQQTVVSYITSGWPPEDIYVIENTGTMDANRLGQLSLQNPFYLNYQRLTDVFGVKVISTPTLLTFAQLQNFFIYTARSMDVEFYFWSHMDVAALSAEDFNSTEGKYQSLYSRCVDDLRETLDTPTTPDKKGRTGGWAIKFYAYDHLALVNRSSFESVGGWDNMIPYYGTDCDMHTRLSMSGFKQADGHVGLVFDLARSLKDLKVLYRRRPKQADEDPQDDGTSQPEDDRASSEYIRLRDQLNSMSVDKNNGNRNIWQSVQQGGEGEPFHIDPRGFEKAIEMWIEHGKTVMAEKWGHRGCNLIGVGLGKDDAWKVKHDWK